MSTSHRSKNTLYYIPIEPLVDRYTEQWYRQFPKQFTELGYKVEVIDGLALSSFVETGTFLDINSTVFYKAEQLKKIAALFYQKKIVNGDKFFVADLEFWGIEVIRYMAHLQNIRVGIYGFLHAASYTKEDYMEPATPYAKYFELGWLKICDYVFVGTHYHKEAVVDRRIKPYADQQDVKSLSEKIVVTGNPLFFEEYHDFGHVTKRNQIVISNRFDWEKRPNLSLDFAQLLKARRPDVEIIVCTSRPKFTSNKAWLLEYARLLEKQKVITIHEGLSKAAYHQILANSKVMLTNSIEENFGYCVVEALWYGCAPLCPDSCSHPELVFGDSGMLFSQEDEILDKMLQLIDNTPDLKTCRAHVKRYGEVIPMMAFYMDQTFMS